MLVIRVEPAVTKPAKSVKAWMTMTGQIAPVLRVTAAKPNPIAAA
jgi:hypothetical protein